MLVQLFTILSTAVLSSLLTLALAYWWIDRLLRRRLERRMDELQEELGAALQERVRRGVVEGVASIPSTAVLKGTGQTLTATAGDLLRGG
jgi:hypothetical protein